jgi:hypothetical protein
MSQIRNTTKDGDPDPDPYRSEKLDLDPPLSQNSKAIEAQNRAVEGD